MGFRQVLHRAHLVSAALLAVTAHDAMGQDGETAIGGRHDGSAFVFESADGAFAFSPTARLQVDAAGYFGSSTDLSSGTAIRRARLGIEALLFTDWEAEFDIDFADNEIELKDAMLAYHRITNTVLRFGQFKEPFGLEQTTSSADVTLMERAYTDALSPDRAIGAAASRWGDRWLATVAVFGENASAVDESGRDEGVSVAAQVRFVPVQTSRLRVQLGAAVGRRTPAAADSGTVAFSSRPESSVSEVRFLQTGVIDDVRRTDRFNLEALVVAGPLSLQGEWTRATVRRNQGDARPLDAAYAMVSYFLTGESRTFRLDKAEFDEIIPRRRSGAWEVAARYSMIDLNHGDLLGGAARNFTAGVSWYANANIKWMLNYLVVSNDDHAGAVIGPASAGDSFSVLQARMAFTF